MRSLSTTVLLACVLGTVLFVTGAPTAVQADEIHYRSDWSAPRVHFEGPGGWSAAPGIPMQTKGAGWWVLDAPGPVRQLLFNDGSGRWDHAPGIATNGSRNYQNLLGRSVLFVDNGVLTYAPGGPGELHRFSFPSQRLGETRRVTLYLPAGYDRLTSRRYPVIYLSDGQNLFDESAFFGGWQVDRAVEETSGSGRARQVIVVGVDNTPDRIRDYTPTPDPHYGGGGADRYLDFIEHELKPWIDTALRTEAGPDETCIGGSSLGGLLALHAGLTRPWVFGRVLSMSPSLWWDAEELLERIRGAQGVPGIAIYLDSGGPQDGLVRTALLRDLLFGHGLRYGVDLWHWVELSHGHNEAAWRARLPRALGLVFPAR